MSILNDFQKCIFISPDGEEFELIVENISDTFKRKVQSGTINNLTYAQDEGKDTIQLTLNFLFFDHQPKGSEAMEILKKKMENYNSDIENNNDNCYKQASYFMNAVSKKASNKKPAYLQHPLFPDKVKVCVIAFKNDTSLVKNVGMSKVSVTFILVDRYGLPPDNSVNKNSIGSQFFKIYQPLLEAICKKGTEEEYDRKKLMGGVVNNVISDSVKD